MEKNVFFSQTLKLLLGYNFHQMLPTLPFLFLPLPFLLAPHAYSSELSVAPTHFELEKPAGQSISEGLVIYNSGPENIRVSLSVGDFWYDKENKRSFPDAGSSPFSGASWLVLALREVEVPARGRATASFLLSVPPNPTPSSYATIFVERSVTPDLKRGRVGMALRIAVPVLYRRPDEDISRVSLQKFSMTKPTPFQPLLLKFRLRNDDDIYAFPKADVSVVDAGSKALIAKAELKDERIVLPKQGVDFELPVSISPNQGNYEGLLTLFYANKHLVQSFSFSIP